MATTTQTTYFENYFCHARTLEIKSKCVWATRKRTRCVVCVPRDAIRRRSDFQSLIYMYPNAAAVQVIDVELKTHTFEFRHAKNKTKPNSSSETEANELIENVNSSRFQMADLVRSSIRNELYEFEKGFVVAENCVNIRSMRTSILCLKFFCMRWHDAILKRFTVKYNLRQFTHNWEPCSQVRWHMGRHSRANANRRNQFRIEWAQLENLLPNCAKLIGVYARYTRCWCL